MSRLIRILMLTLLMVGLPLQGAWAASAQCNSDSVQQLMVQGETIDHAGMHQSHTAGGADLEPQDCGTAAAVTCTTMALLPSLLAISPQPGSGGAIAAPPAAAMLFLTSGQDRPPRWL